MIRDEEVLGTILSAIGALAERLTGQTMLFCIPTTDGEWQHFYSSGRVTWIPRAAEDPPDRPPGYGPMRCSIHGVADATSRWPVRPVEE